MSARTKLAAAGLLLLAVRLAVGGESGALPDRLLRGFTPEQIVETAVRLELGTLRAAGDSAVETAEAATPAPVAEPASTPEPEGTPTPAPAPVGVSAEGVPIVPTTIQGGLTMKNETEFSMDLRALLQEGPSIRLAAGQPQVLIVHTHGSEAYTPEGSDRYDASDSCRTEDTNYNIVRVGDTLTAALEQAGLNVLHDRTIYDYPSYTGSYARSGAAALAYLETAPIPTVVKADGLALGKGVVIAMTRQDPRRHRPAPRRALLRRRGVQDDGGDSGRRLLAGDAGRRHERHGARASQLAGESEAGRLPAKRGQRRASDADAPHRAGE